MHRSRSRIDLAIESCWLIALALVPLAFNVRDVVVFTLQPKDLILHFFALLIVALWGFEWALGKLWTRIDFGSWTAIRCWLGRNPRNWALLGAAGFGVATTISTILSPLPAVSLWGRDFSQLGYELYSVLSFLVIFFAIAIRVREPGQVKRILWVIVGAGVLTGGYGVSQHFGWDPIGNGAGQARVISSFGNPIFFGSYLLMSVLLTLGLTAGGSNSNDRWWLPVAAALVGVQFAALWFTGSRGPWIGTLVGVVAFVALGRYALSPHQLQRSVLITIAGLVFAVVIVNIPGNAGDGDSRGLGSIVSGVTPGVGDFGGRTEIWESGVRLLDSWEGQEFESAAALRPVFGLGPEMFHYSYPLTASPQKNVIVASNAHNSPLQLVLELGVAGLVTFTVVAISVLVAGLTYLRRPGRISPGSAPLLTVSMVAVLAALIGRSAEQMVGLARVGDMVPFWALLAVVLAVYSNSDAEKSGRKVQISPRSARPNFAPVGAAAIVAVLALATFVFRDAQMLNSGITAADAFGQSAAGNTTEAIESLKKAAENSPDVEQYHIWAGDLLIKQAQSEEDLGVAIALLRDARDILTEFEDRNSLAFATQIRLGLAEAELVNLGDNTVRIGLIGRSLNIAGAMPSYPVIQALAAERVLLAGQLELGLQLADRAIAMETDDSPQALAWFMRGNALGDLGDVDGALESFLTSLDRDPNGDTAPGVHRNIALVYAGMGKTLLATEHRELADDIQAALGHTPLAE